MILDLKNLLFKKKEFTFKEDIKIEAYFIMPRIVSRIA